MIVIYTSAISKDLNLEEWNLRKQTYGNITHGENSTKWHDKRELPPYSLSSKMIL